MASAWVCDSSGQGRNAAAKVACLWVLLIGSTLEFYMNDSNNFWKEYKKGVTSLDRSNLDNYKSTEMRYIFLKNQDEITLFMNRRNVISTLSVGILSKADRKNFNSQAFIDLHGHTREIDNTLAHFCSRCILNNLKEVTIITGKGEGILKEATVVWLKKNPDLIVGYFEILDSQNGCGAYGVRLRNPKKRR